MSPQLRISLVALCLTACSACAPNRFATQNESPKVSQCASEALEACQPLVADDVAGCAAGTPACAAAALKADTVNRERSLDCQRRHAAAVACLRTLQASGVLTVPKPTTDR